MTQSATSNSVILPSDTIRIILMMVALCLAVGWFFVDALLGGGAFFVQDVMVQNVPFRHHLHEALAQGNLPLWVPQISAGFPLFAEGQVGALYPPNLICALFLSPWQAVNVTVVGHLMLASVGMGLFVLHLRSGLSGAIVAGLCYGLSGYLVVRAMSPNFVAVAAWLPLLLMAVDRGVTSGRCRPILWGAVIVCLQWLAGHPQATAYGIGAALIYAALRTRRGGVLSRITRVGLGVGVAGLILAAVQILPTAELMMHSQRASGLGFDRFVQMSMAPERLMTLVLPSLMGDSSYGTYWGAHGDFFIQMCPYVGVLALPLIWVAVSERAEATTFALGVVAGVGLLLSLGKFTGLFEMLYELPFMRLFRIPTRFLLWWAVAGSALAGLGADRLLRGPVRRRQWLVSLPLAGLCLTTSMVVAGQVPDMLQMADQHPAQLWRSGLQAETVRALLLLLFFALLVVGSGWRKGPVARQIVSVLLPLVVLADLSSFGRGFNAVIDSRVYESEPEVVAAIHRDRGAETDTYPLPAAARFRVGSIVTEQNSGLDRHAGWRYRSEAYRRYPETLRDYVGGMYGLATTLPGWSPLHLASYRQLADASPAIFKLASVAYVVIPRTTASDTADIPLSSSTSTMVRRNDDWMPRAYVVDEAIVVREPSVRLRALTSGFNTSRQVLLSSGESLRPAAGPQVGQTHRGKAQAAQIVEYTSTRVVVDLPQRSESGYLVLTDVDYPGWRVRVDGQDAAIERANHAFRAVRLSPSATRVEFDYRPDWFRRGLWLSLTALVGLGSAFWWTRREPMGESPAATDQIEPPICSRAWLVQGMLIFILYGLATRTGEWAAWTSRLNIQSLLGSG